MNDPRTLRRVTTLADLHGAAAECRACPLWERATQVVTGEGPVPAPVMFVGEQPGDREDLTGRPFVGAAGRMMDTAFDEVGIDRRGVFVTNAVKHFKYEPRGKRRIHQRPNRDEVDACNWWLQEELRLVRPKLLVALGVTAAEAILGRPVTINRIRGVPIERPDAPTILVTVHPSSILRIPDEQAKNQAFAGFTADLQRVLALVPDIRGPVARRVA